MPRKLVGISTRPSIQQAVQKAADSLKLPVSYVWGGSWVVLPDTNLCVIDTHGVDLPEVIDRMSGLPANTGATVVLGGVKPRDYPLLPRLARNSRDVLIHEVDALRSDWWVGLLQPWEERYVFIQWRQWVSDALDAGTQAKLREVLDAFPVDGVEALANKMCPALEGPTARRMVWQLLQDRGLPAPKDVVGALRVTVFWYFVNVLHYSPESAAHAAGYSTLPMLAKSFRIRYQLVWRDSLQLSEPAIRDWLLDQLAA